MSRMLGSKAEAKQLSRHLLWQKLEDLGKVPHPGGLFGLGECFPVRLRFV